jgi:hypothetical protein
LEAIAASVEDALLAATSGGFDLSVHPLERESTNFRHPDHIMYGLTPMRHTVVRIELCTVPRLMGFAPVSFAPELVSFLRKAYQAKMGPEICKKCQINNSFHFS